MHTNPPPGQKIVDKDSLTNQPSCVECPSNSYQDVGLHQEETCKPQPYCSAGQYFYIEPMKPGVKKFRGVCRQCADNTYQDDGNHRNEACKPQPYCSAGQKLSGATLETRGNCISCEPGTYQGIGAHQFDACELCSPPECPKGYQMVGACSRTGGNTLECSKCPEDTYGDTVHAVVKSADATIPSKNGVVCQPCSIKCPDGQYPAYGGRMSEKCPSGSVFNGATCNRCPSGTWKKCARLS